LANIYYEKACNLNNGGGCNNLGVLYAKGQGVVQSKTTAKGYYRKACDLGEQLGCNNYRGLNEQDY
jgi:TPR repeat protein